MGKTTRQLDVHARARPSPLRARDDAERRRQPRLDGDPPAPPGVRRGHDSLRDRGDGGARVAVAAGGRDRVGAHTRREPARRDRVRIRPELPDPEAMSDDLRELLELTTEIAADFYETLPHRAVLPRATVHE